MKMIKLTFCIKRKDGITMEEFRDYWLNHHGPLFSKYAKDFKAVRYVQSHTIDSPLNEIIKKSRGFADEYDGIGEIWWQSEQDFLAGVNNLEQGIRKMFIDDEAKFIDHKKSSGFFTKEHVLVDDQY